MPLAKEHAIQVNPCYSRVWEANLGTLDVLEHVSDRFLASPHVLESGSIVRLGHLDCYVVDLDPGSVVGLTEAGGGSAHMAKDPLRSINNRL